VTTIQAIDLTLGAPDTVGDGENFLVQIDADLSAGIKKVYCVEYDVDRVMRVIADHSFVSGAPYTKAGWIVVPFQFTA
jgi:hypothetical protein